MLTDLDKYIGNKYGNLTVIALGGMVKDGKSRKNTLLCRCDCGKERRVAPVYLRIGKATSCGCMRGKKKSKYELNRYPRTGKEKKTRCECPKCKGIHYFNLYYTGKLPARIYCRSCREENQKVSSRFEGLRYAEEFV